MEASFTIQGELPTLNQYISAERSSKFSASSMKRKVEEMIALSIMAQKVPRFTRPVQVTFTWYRGDRRTDKDNVAFAKKFILDAMQTAGVIQNDSWKMVTPLDISFRTDRRPRVLVHITDEVDI